MADTEQKPKEEKPQEQSSSKKGGNKGGNKGGEKSGEKGGNKQPKEKKVEEKKPEESYIDSLGYGFFKLAISDEMQKLTNVDSKSIYGILEGPRNPEHGDVALPVPRLNQFGKLAGSPANLATEWAEKFPKNDVIVEVNPIGPFLNFKINKAKLVQQTLRDVWEQKDKFGWIKTGEGKTVVVEFSSPNIAKPFHAGHLRSTIIGNFLANIHDAMGYKTIRINYLGDWGKQYGLLALGFLQYGSEEELQKDPIKHLFDIYVRINKEAKEDESVHDKARAYFKRMEEGEKEALDLWKRFRELSIEKYKQIYARLNVRFDIYSGESMFEEGMKEELARLQEKNLMKESNGAQIVDLNEYGLGVAIIKTKDGTTLYITRDLAAASYRAREYKFDKMYYVVAMPQELHFRQLFKMLDMVDYKWASNCHHIGFGMVSGMSTRSGNVVFLEDILDEAQRTMHDVMKQNEHKYSQIENPLQVSDIVGLSAVVVQDLSARRVKDYDFDWERITSFEGDTGPYLQFAHSRLCSIERKSGIELTGNEDLDLLKEDHAIQLVQVIARYPEALRQAFISQEPCVIITYAMSLSHAISVTLEDVWVMGVEPNLAAARLLLYYCARIVLGNCLTLIGLTPLERM